MRILLLGDYSNVHATLAHALRKLGHEVVLASDGDGWKNYPRDIDLKRKSKRMFYSIGYYFRIWWQLCRFRDFDVVQLINPVFLPLKAERHWLFFKMLRRRNKKIFMGAFGMDYYWVKTASDCKTFRYSDFNMGSQFRRRADNDIWVTDWLLGPKGELNRRVAAACDGIVAGLYEYYESYLHDWAPKLAFIPFPIIPAEVDESVLNRPVDKVRFFIGIQKRRSSYKGTDIMLRALQRCVTALREHSEMVVVESVPFSEYRRLMRGCDVLLDQLYSYTPAMNALEAMSQGLVVVGGGEPEGYDILGEHELRPIVNVLPNEDDVYEKLCWIVEHRSELPRMKRQSMEYVRRHHEYLKVAQRYLDFWRERGK